MGVEASRVALQEHLLELAFDDVGGLYDQAAVLAEGIAVIKPADAGPLHLEG